MTQPNLIRKMADPPGPSRFTKALVLPPVRGSCCAPGARHLPGTAELRRAQGANRTHHTTKPSWTPQVARFCGDVSTWPYRSLRVNVYDVEAMAHLWINKTHFHGDSPHVAPGYSLRFRYKKYVAIWLIFPFHISMLHFWCHIPIQYPSNCWFYPIISPYGWYALPFGDHVPNGVYERLWPSFTLRQSSWVATM